MTTAENIIRLRELIGARQVGMLTSRAPDGQLHARPLTLAEIDDEASLWFFVDAGAEWVSGLAVDEPVNVSFSDEAGQTWTSVAGEGRVMTDLARVDRLWNPAAELFFPGGKESPTLRLLTINATSAEYWDVPSSRVKRMAILAKAAVLKQDPDLGESGSLDLG